MTDRQPGAPGQYKMTVDASQSQKLMTGEPVTVTLTRDDQPLVEGTPYNKASVLPDDLAAKVCPDVTDPTPADALKGMTVKSVEATLTTSGWSSSSTGGYVQTITVSGLTDEKKAKSYPVWPSSLTQKIALAEETAKVRACTRSGNKMTFEAWEEKPASNIPIIVEVYV